MEAQEEARGVRMGEVRGEWWEMRSPGSFHCAGLRVSSYTSFHSAELNAFPVSRRQGMGLRDGNGLPGIRGVEAFIM